MPSQEKPESHNQKAEANKQPMIEIGNKLLNDWKISEVRLSREQRKGMQESQNPEDAERLKEYQYNKKRKNWFTTLQLFLDNAIDNEFLDVENREDLKKEKEIFFEEVEKIKFGVGEEPSDALIEKGDELLRKILNKQK